MAAFFDRHTFGRSCRWQVLEMTKYTVKLISARGKPRLTEFEYMIGKSEKTFESVIITLLLCNARKAYAHTTAAALRAKEDVMKTVTAVREGADDIYAEAKAINERRAAAEAAAVVEDASAEDAKAE